MRVFLSIDLPDTGAAQMASVRNQIKHPVVKEAEHSHITLSFFGDVTPADVMIIQRELKKISCPSFTLTTQNKLGAFANWRRLRTIFVPVEYNKTLNQLAIKLQNLFPHLESSRKQFDPHVTLARVKQDLHDNGEYAAFLQSLILDQFSWKVNELILYESILRPEGPTYKRLASVKLE